MSKKPEEEPLPDFVIKPEPNGRWGVYKVNQVPSMTYSFWRGHRITWRRQDMFQATYATQSDAAADIKHLRGKELQVAP